MRGTAGTRLVAQGREEATEAQASATRSPAHTCTPARTAPEAARSAQGKAQPAAVTASEGLAPADLSQGARARGVRGPAHHGRSQSHLHVPLTSCVNQAHDASRGALPSSAEFHGQTALVPSPGRVAQRVRAASPHTKVAGSVSGQGTCKKPSTDASISETTNPYFPLSLPLSKINTNLTIREPVLHLPKTAACRVAEL